VCRGWGVRLIWGGVSILGLALLLPRIAIIASIKTNPKSEWEWESLEVPTRSATPHPFHRTTLRHTSRSFPSTQPNPRTTNREPRYIRPRGPRGTLWLLGPGHRLDGAMGVVQKDECGRWMGSEVGVGRGKEAGASEEGLYVFASGVGCWSGEVDVECAVSWWGAGATVCEAGESEAWHMSRREDGRERERGRSVHGVGVWMGWWCVRLGVCWGHQGWWSGRRVSGCECAGASCIGECGAGRGWGSGASYLNF
jgi:hypothetical protein